MDPRTITNYQNWARRGYVDPLLCPNDQLYLLVANTDELTLECCYCKYRKKIGLFDYRNLQSKASLAKYLHESKNGDTRKLYQNS